MKVIAKESALRSDVDRVCPGLSNAWMRGGSRALLAKASKGDGAPFAADFPGSDNAALHG